MTDAEELALAKPTKVLVPGEILVPLPELQVGDRLVARYTASARYDCTGMDGKPMPGRLNVFPAEILVKKLPRDLRDVLGTFAVLGRTLSTDGLTLDRYFDRGDKLWIRPRGTAVDASLFPHDCPYCGKKAYVGSTRVEHMTVGSCTAR